MADLFHQVAGAAAVTYAKGVYRQADLYDRAGFLYARHGGGYIRLRGNGRTSHPDVSVVEIDPPPGAAIVEDPAQGVVRFAFSCAAAK